MGRQSFAISGAVFVVAALLVGGYVTFLWKPSALDGPQLMQRKPSAFRASQLVDEVAEEGETQHTAARSSELMGAAPSQPLDAAADAGRHGAQSPPLVASLAVREAARQAAPLPRRFPGRPTKEAILAEPLLFDNKPVTGTPLARSACPSSPTAARFVSCMATDPCIALQNMPEALVFFTEKIAQSGGYVRQTDGEKVTIDWVKGEDPRFELVCKGTGKIALQIGLFGLSLEDIEKLLGSHGFKRAVPG